MQYNSSSGVITVGLDRDEAGRLLLVSQGEHTIAYDYHNAYLDLVEEQIYPQLTVYLEYDSAGNMISKKVNGSDKTLFDYDSRNRLIRKDYPSGTSDVQYTYYSTDKLRTAKNGWGDWSFEYDDNGNPVVRLLATNNKTYRFEYQYDPQNNLSGISYPSGLDVDYAPNAFGQATKVGIFANNVLHHPQGSMRSFTYGNGLTYELPLAANKVLIGGIRGRAAGVDVIHKSYDYDSEINIISIIDHINPQYSVSQFEYDEINRLTKASSPSWGGVISFGYDKTGNITSQVLPTGTKTYSYDGSNQLTQVSGLVPQTFGYDLYGNVRNNGRHSFIYNDAGQLISAKYAAGGKVYIYDALGKRIQVINAEGDVTYEIYDGSDRLLLVEESDGTLKHKIYLGNKLIAQQGGSSVRYMHFDPLGSTVAVSDQSGQLQLEHYRPYGDKVEDPQGTRNRQWYTGKPFDSDIALSYHGARYYDPAVGRFYSVDPVDFTNVHNFNRYAYANNNPYKYIDPDGRFAILLPMAAGAIIGALINTSVQMARAEGSFMERFSQVDFKQVGVAAGAGALGGAAGAVAGTAATTAGTIGANIVAGGAIGAGAVHASAAVDGRTASVGEVAKGMALGAGLSGGAGVIAAAPRAAGRATAASMSQTERVAAGNLGREVVNATKSGGGNPGFAPAGQGVANAVAATISNAGNLQAQPPLDNQKR